MQGNHWTRALVIFLILGTLQGQDTPQEKIDRYFKSAQKAFAEDELDRVDSDAREVLGLALDQLGVIYSALAESELAEKAFTQAIRSSASSAAPLLGLAILHLRTGDYEKGISVCRKVLEINPMHSQARHILGKIYFMQGDLNSSIDELRNSYQTQRGPRDMSVTYTLALAYLKRQDLEEARKIFDELTKELGDSPQLHVLFGRAYRATANFEDAKSEFVRAIELNPRFPRAHYYLGLTHLLEKDSHGFPEAIREFELELELDPTSYLPHFFLGVIYSQKHEPEKALPHLRKAVQSRPDSADPNLFLGDALYQKGDLEAAIPYLEKSIELTEDVSRSNFQIANAYFLLGRSFQSTGRREEAIPYLKTAQELKARQFKAEPDKLAVMGLTGEESGSGKRGPTHLSDLVEDDSSKPVLDYVEPEPEARQVLLNTAGFYRAAAARACQLLARLASSNSDFGEAARYLKESLFWDPSVPEGYYNLGVALVRTAAIGEAVDPLVQAVRQGQSVTRAKQLLAHLSLRLLEANQFVAAEKAVDCLLEVNPEVPDLLLIKGNLLGQQGRFEEALQYYRTLLAEHPEIPEAHYHAGTALLRQGRLTESVAEFDAELALNPEHVKALYHKGLVLITQKQPAEAIPLLLEVIRLDPNYADAYYQLGKAQTDKDQLLLAMANLETAAHLQPYSSYIFYQLSRTYMKAGRREDAQKAFETYRKLKEMEEEARLKRLRQPGRP